jgi:hypothetical protein
MLDLVGMHGESCEQRMLARPVSGFARNWTRPAHSRWTPQTRELRSTSRNEPANRRALLNQAPRIPSWGGLGVEAEDAVGLDDLRRRCHSDRMARRYAGWVRQETPAVARPGAGVTKRF